MKKSLFLICAALILSALPSLPGWDRPPIPAETAVAEPETAAAFPEETEPPPEDEDKPEADEEAARTVRLLWEGQLLEMDLEDYLPGVLAAEVPADFEPEALKAQAVAARTYALYCAACQKHGEADICADYRCCQAWMAEAELRERWGDAFPERWERLRRAVRETEGESLRYEGAPVFAAFHASSPGATEDSGRVWNPLPYLVSVPSPETAETVPDLVSTRELTALDLRDTVLSAHPEADFTGAPETWVGETTLDPSGRVERMNLGGVELSGTELRGLFSLRSAAFTLEYEPGEEGRAGLFRFTVYGSGHGVGMSQHGAQLLAAQGLSYREILAHYYPGTVLEKET